jgi:hypothetical protein
MDIETLLKCMIRLKTAMAFLDEPARRLQLDISQEGSDAVRRIYEAHGMLSAVLLDLTDAVRDRQPMAVRRIQ